MKLIIQTKTNFSSENISELTSLLQEQIGSNFEFIFIEPKDKSYKIEEIKNFTSKLNRKQSDLTQNLFYILLYGDNLSPVCQNALLKTLEESAYSIGILVKNTNSLLPTIKSRCQTLNLSSRFDEVKTGISSSSSHSEINLDYSKLAKLDRNLVIKELEETIESLKNDEVTKTLPLQNAIDKLNANCKVEAVLVEMERALGV